MSQYVEQNETFGNDMYEIVNYKPHWIIRRGSFIFLILLISFFSFTWFIKYPDIIKGSMKIVALNAPKLLVARKEGKLTRLLVDNEQDANLNQPIAFLQSTANHRQVLSLQHWINTVEPLIIKDSLAILMLEPLPVFDQLGEIQVDYQNFQNIFIETLQVLNNGYYEQKKEALKKDLDYLSSIQNNAKQQKILLEQDYDLQKAEYIANETLAKDRVIAPIELHQNKSKVIGKEQAVWQIQAQLVNNNIAENNKQKEILDVQKYVCDQKQKFRSELFNLKSKVAGWVEQYIIVAPESGKVIYSSFLQENQLLTLGQELFYLQPHQSRYYGELVVSQNGLGKIKVGQKVLVKVESYPSNEFGYILGVVNYISNISTPKDSVIIKIDLPRGLRTSYNKIVCFRNNLLADGEVITDHRRLFDRFIGQVKDILKR